MPRPPLPELIPDTVRLKYPNIHIPANRGWSQYKIVAEAGEEFTVEVGGSIVYYYRTWTERGSSGKKKRKVDRRTTGPAKPWGLTRFGVGPAGSSKPATLLRHAGGAVDVEKSATFVIPEGATGRFHGVLLEADNRNAGDNSGSFNLSVKIDASGRIANFEVLLSELRMQLADDGVQVLTREIGTQLLDAFPSRVIHNGPKHRAVGRSLAHLGHELIKQKARDPEYLELADWIGEWINSEFRGGNPRFGFGYVLRADVAMERNQAEFAEKFLEEAYKFSDPEDRANVLYKLGKVKEFKGELFSTIDLKDVENIVVDGVGAYDLYKKALITFLPQDSLGQNGEVAADKRGQKNFQSILQYDCHYALGRLEYMRHTTESLRSSASHFRLCRRLARFRFLTHASLYHNYSFDLLLNDSRRSHLNPCHSQPGESDRLIGLRDYSLTGKAEIEFAREAGVEGLEKDAELFEKDTRFDWFALVNSRVSCHSGSLQPAHRSVVASDPLELIKAAYSRNIPKMPDESVDPVKREILEKFWLTKDGVAQSDIAAESILEGLSRIFSAATDESGYGLGAVIQNPVYWLDFALRYMSYSAIAVSPVNLKLVDFSEFRLTEYSFEPEQSVRYPKPGTSIDLEEFEDQSRPGINMLFKHPSGAKLIAYSEFVGDRLSIHKIEAEFGGSAFALHAVYEPEIYPRVLRVIELRVAGKLEGISSAEKSGKIKLSYRGDGDGPRGLLSNVLINDWRGTRFLKHHSFESGSSYEWKFSVDIGEEDRSGVELGHQSLATAYIPFHTPRTSDSFERVEARDVRWALTQGGYEPLWFAMVQRLGETLRKDDSSLPDDAQEARDVLLDLALSPGSFGSAMMSRKDLAALAAAALIVEPERGGRLNVSDRYRQHAYQALSSLMDQATLGASFLPALSSALESCVLPLALPAPGPLLDVRELDPTSEGTREEDQAAQPVVNRQIAQWTLTISCLEALTRCYNDMRFRAALLRHISANSLVDTAVIRLAKAGIDMSGALNGEPTAGDAEFDTQDELALIFQLLEIIKLVDVGEGTLEADTGAVADALQALGYFDQKQQLQGLDPESDGYLVAVFCLIVRLLNQLTGQLARAAYSGVALPSGCVEPLVDILILSRHTDRELDASASVDALAPSIVLCLRNNWAGETWIKGVPEKFRSRVGEHLEAGVITYREPLADGVELSDEERSNRLTQELDSWKSYVDGLVENLAAKPKEDQATKHVTTQIEASASTETGIMRFHTEISESNLRSWELTLHDEPYGDCVSSLLALADRLAARGDGQSAAECLSEARLTLTKLAKEDYHLISPADRHGMYELGLRLEQRRKWLAQERDAYGQFLSQAPPRRLDVVVADFKRQLETYRIHLDRGRKLLEQEDAAQRYEQQVELQMSSSRYDEQEAVYNVERHNRILAETSAQITRIHAERNEQSSEALRGEAQYKKGQALAKQAAGDLGGLVAAAAASYIPAAGAAAGIQPETVSKVTKAFSAIDKLGRGEDPLRVALESYGADMLSHSFSAFGDSMYANDFSQVAKNSLEQYLDKGQVDLGEAVGQVAKARMREFGEQLYDAHLKGMAENIESLVEDAQSSLDGVLMEAYEGWTEIKEDAETWVESSIEFVNGQIGDAAEEWAEKPAAKLRVFLNRARLNVDARASVAEQLLDAATSAVREKLKEEIDLHDFPLHKVVRGLEDFAHMTDSLDDSVREHARNAVTKLADKVLSKDGWALVAGSTQQGIGLNNLHAGASSLESFAQLLQALAGDDNVLDDIDLRRHVARELKKVVNGQVKALANTLPLPLERLAIQLDLGEEELTTKSLLRVLSADFQRVAAGSGDQRRALEQLSQVTGELARQLGRVAEQGLDPVIDEALDQLESKVLEDLRSNSTEKLQVSIGKIFESAEGHISDLLGDVRRHVLTSTNFLEQVQQTITSEIDGVDARLKDIVDHGLIDIDELLGTSADKMFNKVMKGLALSEGSAAPLSDRPNGVLQSLLSAGLEGVVDAHHAGSQKPGFTLEKVKLTQARKIKIAATDIENRDELVMLTAAERFWQSSEVCTVRQEELASEETRAVLDTALPTALAPAPAVAADGDPAPEPDELETLLGNPTTQAALTAITAIYPAVGIAVQAVSIIKNWTKGTAQQNDGVKRVDAAEQRIRSLDKDLNSAMHRRELAELDKLISENDQRKASTILLQLGRMRNTMWGQANRDVYLRRFNYRRMWAHVHMLSHHLYVLQKAFEYEFDVPLEMIFQRWPQLENFRALLQLSPGTLDGEFSRTNVHEDMVRIHDELESLDNTIEISRSIIEQRRFVDRITLSLREDFPNEWKMFQKGRIPRMETPLRKFMGVGGAGHEFRHSLKTRRVSLATLLKENSRCAGTSTATLDDSAYVSPSTLGENEERRAGEAAAQAFAIANRFPDRFKVALVHPGTAEQITESGARIQLDWSPQLADSNIGVLDEERHYNPIEGLSPATEWMLLWDTQFGIDPGDIDDIELTIEFSYLRNQANLQHSYGIYAAEEEGGYPAAAEEISSVIGSLETRYAQYDRLREIYR